jgi:hypothetical protein
MDPDNVLKKLELLKTSPFTLLLIIDFCEHIEDPTIKQLLQYILENKSKLITGAGASVGTIEELKILLSKSCKAYEILKYINTLIEIINLNLKPSD